MKPATRSGEIVVLLVEDNPADVVLFEEAIQGLKQPIRLNVVEDGIDAMSFLRGRGPSVGSPRPDVVVLDLNLPRMSGQEVIQDMAADPDLVRIPVAVLTTSTSETWVCNAYPPGRCIYFVKSDNFDALQDIAGKIVLHATEARL